MNHIHSSVLILGLFTTAFIFGGCNPFAPALEEGNPYQHLLGDPTTIDGFFTNFKNGYELRDMSIYQPLIESSFTFIYRDFEAGIDRQWGYAQEIESTRQMFQRADLIRLDWNQIVVQEVAPDNKMAQIIRSFNLTISLGAGEVFRGSGRINFLLSRRSTALPWRLRQWRDESET